MPVRILFHSVKTNAEKLNLIYKISDAAYRNGQRLLIHVPTFQAAHYLDTFLWKSSEESFLPHVVSDMPTSEWIAITQQSEVNINRATRVLNLHVQTINFFDQLEEIHEIYDQTTAEKLNMTKQKIQAYEAKGLKIISPIL